MLDMSQHPCFNKEASKLFGRIHLPVAPKCNIQCGFCNRRFDCMNESRPGVTSEVLSPSQALIYLEKVVEIDPSITVAGIAGPGDPFANPIETMETLRGIRKLFPEMLLCVASNGLGLPEYVDELAELKVTHVTVTVNAVDPEIGAKVYKWIRYKKKIYRGVKGAELILSRQLDAIKRMAEKDITVKVNTIVIPGVNDHHVEDITKKVTSLGADILNLMPLCPVKGTDFENVNEPDCAYMSSLRLIAKKYLPQMEHCRRCRADAVGRLGEGVREDLMKEMKKAIAKENQGDKSCVAVASEEGMLVNRHLGETDYFLIYEKKDGVYSLKEKRKSPRAGGGNVRWERLGGILNDCSAVFVSAAGNSPKKILGDMGIKVVVCEGWIDDLLARFYSGSSVKQLEKSSPSLSPDCISCSGTGMGCG